MSRMERVAAFAYGIDNEGRPLRDVGDHARNASYDAHRADLLMRASEIIVADGMESRDAAIHRERLEILAELLVASRERLASSMEAAGQAEERAELREARDDA